MEEALECYDRAIEINPSYEKAWYDIGATLANYLQQYRKALVYFEEAQRLGHQKATQAIALCQQMLEQS